MTNTGEVEVIPAFPGIAIYYADRNLLLGSDHELFT